MKLVPCIKCGKEKVEMPDVYFGHLLCEACEDEKERLTAAAPDLLEACKEALKYGILEAREEMMLKNAINKAEADK